MSELATTIQQKDVMDFAVESLETPALTKAQRREDFRLRKFSDTDQGSSTWTQSAHR